MILPVSHAVAGMTVVLRTDVGSKLTAAEHAGVVAFEVDAYDDDKAAGLEALGRAPWADRVPRPVWVRLHPQEVSGREIVRGAPTAP